MKRTYRDTPLLHHSVRIGKKRKPIVVSKIRTMHNDAHSERDLKKIEAAGHAHLQLTNDPRIRRMGKFLRGFHIDEVPQIILWLRGKLKPVGIRPLLRQDYRSLPADIQRMYDEMGPGLAGIPYACNPFPPGKEQLHEEYRAFYSLWKKSPTRAYSVYAWRIAKNKALGKAKAK